MSSTYIQSGLGMIYFFTNQSSEKDLYQPSTVSIQFQGKCYFVVAQMRKTKKYHVKCPVIKSIYPVVASLIFCQNLVVDANWLHDIQNASFHIRPITSKMNTCIAPKLVCLQFFCLLLQLYKVSASRDTCGGIGSETCPVGFPLMTPT